MTDVVDARGIGMTFRNGDELTEVLKGVDLTLQSGELVPGRLLPNTSRAMSVGNTRGRIR